MSKPSKHQQSGQKRQSGKRPIPNPRKARKAEEEGLAMGRGPAQPMNVDRPKRRAPKKTSS